MNKLDGIVACVLGSPRECELSVRNFIISEGTEPLEELRYDVTRNAVLDYK